MRSVNKGESPKTYSHYSQARDDLFNVIGSFCSYCEMPIKNSAEVEHVIPKDDKIAPHLKLIWNNFLLSCKYCNTAKGNRNTSRNEYFFPDEDNTSFAFKYSELNIIEPSDALSEEEKIIATKTINLMKLDRDNEEIRIGNYRDTRWESRLEVWNIAKDSLADYKIFENAIMIRQIVRTAIGHGFFSVWLKVFEEYPIVRKEIIAGFKGTELNCFDNNGVPIRGVKRT